jgi:hypothetical protein
MSETSTLISFTGKITRAELAQVPTPPSTASHVPIPHAAVVEALVDTLSHRQISVVDEEFAVSKDGMEMFGVLDLATSFEGCRFAIVIRNANNKRFRLACTVGLRVFVCQNLAFRGDFSPVLAKHSKHLSVEDTPSIGVDRMRRNFEPIRQQVESWRAQQLSAASAKLTIYRAFIEGARKSLGTRRGGCTSSISIHSTRSSNAEPCGTCRTRSHLHSKNSIRFHNSEGRRSWRDFLRGSLRRSHRKQPTCI